MMDERAVHRGLERLVGEIDEDVWGYLVDDERAIEAVVEGDYDLNWLASKYRRLLAIRGNAAPAPRLAPRMLAPTGLSSDPPPGRRSTTELRLEVVSHLVAYEVAQVSEVAAFREEILNGALLQPDQVEAWIKRQAEVDGQATFALSGIPVPTTCRVTWAGGGYAIEPPMTVSLAPEGSYAYLFYGLPDDPALRMWTITAGGVLDRLRRLSDGLANWYGWEAGQATLFVLTGWIPQIQAAEASLRCRRLPSLTRLELKVDPTLTPQEVAEIYRRERANTMGRRYRSLSEKHLTLATFADDAEDTSIEQQMRAWNDAYPEWGYTEPSNFSRDRAQARKRVLYPPLLNDPFATLLRDGPAEVEVVEP